MSGERKTKAVLLQNRPHGEPDAVKDFTLSEITLPQLQDDEILVKTLFLSVDPYMRGRMRDQKSYVPSFQLGKPLAGGGVGRVEESKNPDFPVGQVVTGMMEWSEYNIITKAAATASGLQKVPSDFKYPLSYLIGVLGMPGMTAYFGLLELTNPKAGETVVVSGASGAVGVLVGQIAKLKGCTVIGIAGTDEKVKLLLELGFDSAFNYKTTDNLRDAIAQAAPKGVDVYFDNVGGTIASAVYANVNRFARVSLCGSISNYNAIDPPLAPSNEMIFISRSVRLEGFIVTQWLQRFPEGLKQMTQWLDEGKIKYFETVREGIESMPTAFVEMMRGANKGKMVVKL